MILLLAELENSILDSISPLFLACGSQQAKARFFVLFCFFNRKLTISVERKDPQIHLRRSACWSLFGYTWKQIR